MQRLQERRLFRRVVLEGKISFVKQWLKPSVGTAACQVVSNEPINLASTWTEASTAAGGNLGVIGFWNPLLRYKNMGDLWVVDRHEM
jgi:hypothetical protein